MKNLGRHVIKLERSHQYILDDILPVLLFETHFNLDGPIVSYVQYLSNVQVLPRVVLEAFPAELLTKKKQRSKAITLLVNECK